MCDRGNHGGFNVAHVIEDEKYGNNAKYRKLEKENQVKSLHKT